MAKPAASSDKPAGRADGLHPNVLQPAYRSRRAIIVFIAVALAGAAADLISKHYIFESFLSQPQLVVQVEDVRQRLQDRHPDRKIDSETLISGGYMGEALQQPVMPYVRLTLRTNPGIVFGSEMLPRPLVNVATVLTILLVGFFFATSPRTAWTMHVGLAFIVGGAVGNLYDRLFAQVALPGLDPIVGQVRDFIDFSQMGYPWVFNIADVLLVVGVGMIMLEWILESRKRPRPAQQPPAADKQ